MVDEYIYDEIDLQGVSYLRAFALVAYGLVSYAIGVAGLGLCILAYAGLVPLGFAANGPLPVAGAIAVNMGLLFLFGFQHSLLARPKTKAFLGRFIPAALERRNLSGPAAQRWPWLSPFGSRLVVSFGRVSA
jgi:hypothetical protein